MYLASQNVGIEFFFWFDLIWANFLAFNDNKRIPCGSKKKNTITTKVATRNLTPCINKMYKKEKKEGKKEKKEGDERNKVPCIFQ